MGETVKMMNDKMLCDTQSLKFEKIGTNDKPKANLKRLQN